MPLRMHFVSGQWQPGLLCDHCSEPITPDKPGTPGSMCNFSGTPTPPHVIFLHAGDCRRRHELMSGVYTFHELDPAALAALL